MKIPEDAIIAKEKITQYLLIAKKSGDKSKYLARGGFTPNNTEVLESEIRRLSAEIEAAIDRVEKHGVYYNVIGEIMGPSGVALPVRVVWLQRLDGVFSFVTLVPEKREVK